MPEKVSLPPLLAALNKQAAEALASLRKEITERQRELERLKAEAARWKNVVGEEIRRPRAGVPTAPARADKGPRLDWSAVLKELPARFALKDVAQKTERPMQHVYVAVARWMKDKKIRKSKDGYQKIAAVSS